jgi:hypothetical protein
MGRILAYTSPARGLAQTTRFRSNHTLCDIQGRR